MNLPPFQMIFRVDNMGLVPPPPCGFKAMAARCDDKRILAIDYLPADHFEEAMGGFRAQSLTAGQERLIGMLEPLLRDYFRAPSTCFKELWDFLRPAPTPFQQKVRDAVFGTHCGKVLAYSEIDGNARNVGVACGKNPFAIVVPCFRVIRVNGTLGEFRGNAYLESGCKTGEEKAILGREMKRWFLVREGFEVAGKSRSMANWEVRRKLP